MLLCAPLLNKFLVHILQDAKNFHSYRPKTADACCYSLPDVYLLLLFLYSTLCVSLIVDPFACVCLSEHEPKSAIPPLLPGLNIVSRALPFSVWYPWQHVLPWRAVCLRWLCSPAHCSLFPFPLHYSQGRHRCRRPRFVFFAAHSLQMLLLFQVSNSAMLWICQTFSVFIADLLLPILIPAWNNGPTHAIHIISLYTPTTWPLTAGVLLGFIQAGQSLRRVMFVFSRWAVLKQ